MAPEEYCSRIDAHAGRRCLYDPTTGVELEIFRLGTGWVVRDSRDTLRSRDRERVLEWAEKWASTGRCPRVRARFGNG